MSNHKYKREKHFDTYKNIAAATTKDTPLPSGCTFSGPLLTVVLWVGTESEWYSLTLRTCQEDAMTHAPAEEVVK